MRKGGLDEGMEELLQRVAPPVDREALAAHFLREAPEIAKRQDRFKTLESGVPVVGGGICEGKIAIQISKLYLKALQALDRTVVLEKVPGRWVSAFKKVRSTDVSGKPLLDQDFGVSFI